MDGYEIQIFLHITIAIIAFGVTFALPFLQAWSEKRGVGATRMALEFSQHLEKIVIVPGSVLVALVGIGLIFDDRTGYKDDFPGWLIAAIAWFLAAMVVGAVVQRKNVEAAVDSLVGVAETATLPTAYLAVANRMKLTGAFLGLSVIGVTLLMVWKPGQ